MKLRTIVISAACLSVLSASTSAVSLLAAAAAAKGLVVGAGLTALSSGGSETVVIQTQPGSAAEVVPADHVILQEHKPVAIHTAHTITYSSSPISRLWGAVSNLISAKTKAIGSIFSPHRVVVIVPQKETTTTTSTTTPKPTTTTKRPLISIDIEHPHKPKPQGPIIDVDIEHNHVHKPLVLPSIEVSPSIRRVPVVVNYDYLKK